MKQPIQSQQILEKAISILREHGGESTEFHQDLERLIQLREHWQNCDFRVGLIGITDSGKSSLLNALFGEKDLLPTAARPTSNCIVSGRNSGGEPLRCRIRYLHDKPHLEICGASNIKEALAVLADEEKNPGNKYGVKEIEISSPIFPLPPNVVLVDSPGLDSVNGKAHEEITMNQLLPRLDLVVFLCQHNSNPGEKLNEIFVEINRQKKPLVFLITHADGIAPKLDRGIPIKSLQTVIGEHKIVVRKHLESAGLPAEEIPIFLISVKQPDSGNSAQSEIPEFLDCIQQLLPNLILQREESRRMDLHDELARIRDRATDVPEIEDLPSFIEQRKIRLSHTLEELATIRRDTKGSLQKEFLKAQHRLAQLRDETETLEDARTHLFAAQRIAKEAARTTEEIKNYLLSQISTATGKIKEIGMEMRVETKPLDIGDSELSPTLLLDVSKFERFVNEEDLFAPLRRLVGLGGGREKVLDAKKFREEFDKFFQQQIKWMKSEALRFALRKIDSHLAGLKKEIRRLFDDLERREMDKASFQAMRAQIFDSLDPLIQAISRIEHSSATSADCSNLPTSGFDFEEMQLPPLSRKILETAMRIAKVKKIAVRNKALELSAKRVGAKATEKVLLVGFEAKSFLQVTETYWHDFDQQLVTAKKLKPPLENPFHCLRINMNQRMVSSLSHEDESSTESCNQPEILFLIVNVDNLPTTMNHILHCGILGRVNRKCGVIFLVQSGVINFTKRSLRRMVFNLSEMVVKFNLTVDAVILDEEHSFFSTVFDTIFQKLNSGVSMADEQFLLRSMNPRGDRQQHFLNCGVEILRELGQGKRVPIN